jgi:hypothetical protein
MSIERAPADLTSPAQLQERVAALEMQPDDFRTVGHALVDRVADFFAAPPEWHDGEIVYRTA